MNYNLFVDESCHLFHDRKSVMCIGYMKVDKDNYENFKNAIFKIKLKHRTPVEIKWRNVSLSRLPLYKELVDFYFASTIDFRCIQGQTSIH